MVSNVRFLQLGLTQQVSPPSKPYCEAVPTSYCQGLRGQITRTKRGLSGEAQQSGLTDAPRISLCYYRCYMLDNGHERHVAVPAWQAQSAGPGVARRRAGRCSNGTLGRLCLFLPSWEISRSNIARADASQRPGKLWRHRRWPRRDWLDHYGMVL